VDIATDTIRRYRGHPSIVVWCGANEGDPPPIVGAGLAAAVAGEDPEILYIPNSAGGIVSGHGPYRWIDPPAYNNRNTYDTGAFGFHTEIGMPVISTTDSMKNLVGDQPEWPISEVWNYHDWSETANQQTAGYKTAIDTRLGASGSLDQFSRRAQFVNYENHRAMFEAWNANLWKDATGLLLWMSHPAWHSTVWQTYDYDLDVNGAYYGSRKACEPVHIQANLPDWRVVAVNHTTQQRKGVSATATVYDLNGKRLAVPTTQSFDIEPSHSTSAFLVEIPDNAPALHLVRLELKDAAGRLLSQNTYWRYTSPSDMQLLNGLDRTRLTVSTGNASSTSDRQSVVATVTNRGATVASMVRLSVRDSDGDRVLPAQYDDNYLWLLPGESRQLTVSWRKSAVAKGWAHVSADAYNASAVNA
jgi:archaellum component FlaF (FlaF/FlaG flagellin family)